MVGLSHALLMFRLVDALGMILAVGSVNERGLQQIIAPEHGYFG